MELMLAASLSFLLYAQHDSWRKTVSRSKRKITEGCFGEIQQSSPWNAIGPQPDQLGVLL